MLQHENWEAKKKINAWIAHHSNCLVMEGPFKGMGILPLEAWQDGSYGTKLLGCYEAELHGCIEREIARLNEIDCPVILNIGSAEGYYAVGMAMRLSHATVYMIDTDHNAMRIAHANAEINNVELHSN